LKNLGEAHNNDDSKKSARNPGVVAHSCNSSYLEGKKEDHEFKASLGSIVRTCLKKRIFKKCIELPPFLSVYQDSTLCQALARLLGVGKDTGMHIFC
jgi:hypothetical protein